VIKGIKIQNEWCEDPVLVKNQLKNSSQKRFVESVDVKIGLDNITFPSLNESDNAMLIQSFSEEEIKDVVWDCESSKSPGPDGFNFSFMKIG